MLLACPQCSRKFLGSGYAGARRRVASAVAARPGLHRVAALSLHVPHGGGHPFRGRIHGSPLGPGRNHGGRLGSHRGGCRGDHRGPCRGHARGRVRGHAPCPGCAPPADLSLEAAMAAPPCSARRAHDGPRQHQCRFYSARARDRGPPREGGGDPRAVPCHARRVRACRTSSELDHHLILSTGPGHPHGCAPRRLARGRVHARGPCLARGLDRAHGGHDLVPDPGRARAPFLGKSACGHPRQRPSGGLSRKEYVLSLSHGLWIQTRGGCSLEAATVGLAGGAVHSRHCLRSGHSGQLSSHVPLQPPIPATSPHSGIWPLSK
mmetsp:Transcript_40901/g.126724  ORF Transcript_40901/g.126724 Transcript_40901/m.126724 type:complete len:321 (-) Transcript_40901:1125-2087(-)